MIKNNKQIKTDSNDLLIIKVSKLAFYFDWVYSKQKNKEESLKIAIYWETMDDRVSGIVTDITDSRKIGNIMCKFSDITEKECSKFVINDEDSLSIWYKNYTNIIDNKPPYSLETAKESLKTLLKFNGIDVTNEDELLLIEIL